MVSNGMALTPQRFEALLAAGLHSTTISLDGFAEQNNLIFWHPKSFDNALNAIKMITNEKDIIYDVVACVTPDNFSSLEAFKNLSVKELGQKLTENQKALFESKIKLSTGQLENTFESLNNACRLLLTGHSSWQQLTRNAEEGHQP